MAAPLQTARFLSIGSAEGALEGGDEGERGVVQAAQRDAEWGRAAAARFPNGSQLGAARVAAELDYGRQVAAVGACPGAPSPMPDSTRNARSPTLLEGPGPTCHTSCCRVAELVTCAAVTQLSPGRGPQIAVVLTGIAANCVTAPVLGFSGQ